MRLSRYISPVHPCHCILEGAQNVELLALTEDVLFENDKLWATQKKLFFYMQFSKESGGGGTQNKRKESSHFCACLSDFLCMFATYLMASLTSFDADLINLTVLETRSSCSRLLFISSECPVGSGEHK